jgi:23S rRNA pseudouridine2604 synthase
MTKITLKSLRSASPDPTTSQAAPLHSAGGNSGKSFARKPPRSRVKTHNEDSPGRRFKAGLPPGPPTAHPSPSARDVDVQRNQHPERLGTQSPSGNSQPSSHENPRLSKRMGELGLCSRREADEWIVNGWVRVDGQVVDTLGVRVSPETLIEIDPAAREHQDEQVTILLHKPVGYVSGQAEDGHPPAIVLIRPENRWAQDHAPIRFKPGHLRGLAPAGRLDIDSTGLLVLTQDGRVARRLIGQDSEVEKEYLVRVEGELSEEGLQRLRHGLVLDGIVLRPARVSWQNEDQLRFVLREGRKRQIRRMCELVGLRVLGLKRVRSGSVPLGALPVGQWRYLRRDEKF